MHLALSAHFWGRPETGSGQYLHRLVEGLRERSEIRLTLVADAAATARGGWPEGLEVVVASTPFDGRSPSLSKLWFEQVALPRAAARMGADLLHVPYFAPPLRATVPVVATIHDLIPMLLPAYRGGLLVRGYTALVARAARRADRILADSEASRRDVVRRLAISPGRVDVVYLAADACFRPQPPERLDAIRERLGLPERFALYLGGFDVRKNVPLLLKATAASRGDWPLVVAGRLPRADRAFTPDPRPIIERLGLETRVRLTGWIDEADKPALLSAATCFVFPSRYEGFGLPLLEAMACGTASITSDRSSLPEIAGDGAAIVPADDPAALAATLDALMEDEAARSALAARGLARAARFSWARCVEETLATYGAVLG